MVKARKISAELLDNPKPKVRALTPLQLKREALDNQLRVFIGRLTSPDDAYEITLDEGEKAATIRLRLLTLADTMKVKIVVRTGGENALLIGLLTPSRETKRGKRKTANMAVLTASAAPTPFPPSEHRASVKVDN